MGYKSGAGLGKNEQGILKPVTVTVQVGKCGLGTPLQRFDPFTKPPEDVISEVH